MPYHKAGVHTKPVVKPMANVCESEKTSPLWCLLQDGLKANGFAIAILRLRLLNSLQGCGAAPGAKAKVFR